MDRRKRESVSEGMGELNRQIERLQRDLGRRERELEEERRETERTMDRMRVLEKDKIDLKRELDEVRDEVTEYQRLVDEIQQDQAKGKGQQKAEDEEARLNNLRSTLQERNREIGQFIQDLEKMNEDKDVLKSKLKEVSGSLQEATKQLSEMTKDRIDLKTKLEKAEELVHRLEQKKTVLEIRERELLAFKESHDQHLENLGNAVDIRVDVWKKMMFQKDEEIESLNAKIGTLMKQIPISEMETEKGMINHLKMKVKEREDHIHLLTNQLQVATEEFNSNTQLIQNLQSQIRHSGSGEETERILRSYEKKVRKLESKVEKRGLALGTAEKEAEEKTKQVVHLTARLRDYEVGQYGLSDAVTEIKDLKGQLRIRDRDLEKLTQDINQFHMEGTELMEENEMLRKKLGHSLQEDLSKERHHFIKTRDEELIHLKTEMEVMEDEITVLKTKNYELKKLLTAAEERQQSHPHETYPRPNETYPRPNETYPRPNETYPRPHEPIHYPPETNHHPQEQYSRPLKTVAPVVLPRTSPDEHWREKYDIILHENTELRKGLQEILDSFQRLGEDGGCNVRVESPILENLLREMSARGLINYPYSISSFHLKVCNLEGKNSQLREELHRTRLWAEGLLDKEKQRCDEWREKALAAQEMVKNNRDDSGKEAEFSQRLKESQLETGRWRRIGEQSEKLIAMLNEKVDESETKILNLEARLENISKESQNIERSSSFIRIPPAVVETMSTGVQTEVLEELLVEKESPIELTVDLESRLRELENLLAAKDEVIENLQTPIPTYEFKSVRGRSPIPESEMQEGLQLARETIQSLTKRLRTKDENLTAYKRLLAEVRGEMQTATERHVLDMNALQSTIHQQQQAFTRMKSTLSHPVKDCQTSDIDGIIREQLTRINELEECVRDLEHTMGNVASQLAGARGDAHRWRTTAETRLKEIDHIREQFQSESPEDVELLRERIRIQDEKIGEMKRLGQTVSILKEMLEEKEMEIQSLKGSAATLPSQSQAQKATVEKPSSSDDVKSEVQRLRKTNQELQTKLSKLQLRVSKMNATNRASGMSGEMEELRRQYDVTVEQRDSLREQIHQMELHTQEDEKKKRKTVDGFARWEEGKKWKKIVQRLEEQKHESEEERGKLNKQIESLRGLVVRLEKEKVLLDSRIKKGVKTSTSDQSIYEDGMVRELRLEIERLRDLFDQNEFTAKEEIERLTMESRILRERIQTQERQLTAYQLSQKGDPKVISEIEKLIQNGDRLQQDLIKMEQENLDLKLQIQELKLETPRLRDRVQHLLKLVDILKTEKTESQRGKTGKSLGELERTISALKSIIDKINKEKKTVSQSKGSKSNMSLRQRRQENLIEEKQLLMDQIHELEEYKSKAQKLQEEMEIKVDELIKERDDAQSRIKSAELKLKTFLDQGNGEKNSSRDRIRALEEELERKSHLLTDAKRALEEITQAKKSSLKRN